MRLTLKAVNAAIKAEGINAELVKGKGYFYFVGADVERAKMEAGVYGCGSQLNSLGLWQWVNECKERVADAKRNS